jgi:hypothetical protein
MLLTDQTFLHAAHSTRMVLRQWCVTQPQQQVGMEAREVPVGHVCVHMAKQQLGWPRAC